MFRRKYLGMQITHYLLEYLFFPLPLPPESAPLDSSMSTPNSYPSVNEMFGRKRKKRTSIETNIRSTLEKRFQDVRGKSFCLLASLPKPGICKPVALNPLKKSGFFKGYLFDSRLKNA